MSAADVASSRTEGRWWHYDYRNLPGDGIAGLTLWAVFAAQALAYSRLAHAGATLYTAGIQPSDLPLPALAGVVLVAAIDLIDVRRLREFQRFRPADCWTAICSAAAVVWLGMIRGIAVGVAVALAEALRRSMHPDRLLLSDRLGPDRYYEPFSSQAVQAADGVLVYRFGAPSFFGNVDVFRDDMRRIADAADGKLHTVVINADALGIPDATARETLLRAQRELAERGIQLEFGNAREPLRRALSEVGEFTLIDEAHFLATLRRLHPPPAR